MSPPMAVRLAADLCPSVDGSEGRTWLQAASVPIAYGRCAPRTAAPWDRRTDVWRYSLMPPSPTAEGIIINNT